MLNNTLEESIKRNWNNVLQNHLLKEDVHEEGLSDVANWIGNKTGFTNPKRDNFIAKNKAKEKDGGGNIGAQRRGSKAVSAINLLGKTFATLTGHEWNFKEKEAKHGGYFDKTNDYDYDKGKNQVEETVAKAINSIVTYLALLTQLKMVCQGTKLGLKEVLNDHFIQFVSQGGNGTLQYGNNLINGRIQGGENGAWPISQSMTEILKRCFGKTKKFVKGENYEWLQNLYQRSLDHAMVNSDFVNHAIDTLGKQMDAIDTALNRLLWGQKVKTLKQAVNSPQVQNLVNKKVTLINREIEKIVEYSKKNVWSAKLENEYDTLPWFIDMNKLNREMLLLAHGGGIAGRDIKEFMQRI